MLPPKSHIHMWPQTTEKSEQVQMRVFLKMVKSDWHGGKLDENTGINDQTVSGINYCK